MVGRRARKSMSDAANDSNTKFHISGKVHLEWLMHRLASPRPGHAHCGVPLLIVSSALRSNLSVVWVVDRLCASCIELSSRTPLQCLPLWSSCLRGAIWILCCIPKPMEFRMYCHLLFVK
ncbi:hypothetical protein V6N13_080348 [Hibiscus sabdariffa]